MTFLALFVVGWVLMSLGRSLWRIATALEKIVAMYEAAGHGVAAPDAPETTD